MLKKEKFSRALSSFVTLTGSVLTNKERKRRWKKRPKVYFQNLKGRLAEIFLWKTCISKSLLYLILAPRPSSTWHQKQQYDRKVRLNC